MISTAKHIKKSHIASKLKFRVIYTNHSTNKGDFQLRAKPRELTQDPKWKIPPKNGAIDLSSAHLLKQNSHFRWA